MINVESLIQSIGDKPLPPVEKWDPEYCGELNLLIKADGSWLYNGTPMTRHKMKHLFSTVLKKEGDQYYLVTPVEKVSIKVEWQPFVIVDFEIIEQNDQPIYQFSDNFGNQVLLTELSQLTLQKFNSPPQPEQLLPTVRIRANLFAGFSRNCYYRLLDAAQIKPVNDQNQVEISSNGLTFCLGHF